MITKRIAVGAMIGAIIGGTAGLGVRYFLREDQQANLTSCWCWDHVEHTELAGYRIRWMMTQHPGSECFGGIGYRNYPRLELQWCEANYFQVALADLAAPGDCEEGGIPTDMNVADCVLVDLVAPPVPDPGPGQVIMLAVTSYGDGWESFTGHGDVESCPP